MGQTPRGRRLLPTDYTKQILFLGDGPYLEDAAVNQKLGGDGLMRSAPHERDAPRIETIR